jgi:hypothetical protein
VDRLLDRADLVDRKPHVADEESHAGKGDSELLDPVARTLGGEVVEQPVDEPVDLVAVLGDGLRAEVLVNRGPPHVVVGRVRLLGVHVGHSLGPIRLEALGAAEGLPVLPRLADVVEPADDVVARPDVAVSDGALGREILTDLVVVVVELGRVHVEILEVVAPHPVVRCLAHKPSS